MYDYGGTTRHDMMSNTHDFYPNNAITLDDHTNIFLNHEDLCRAFQDSERNGYQS